MIEDGPSCALVGGKVRQPAREIPIFHETDMEVGGGSAGFAAAIAAARAGAKVALIEHYGSLDGLFTNGMVLIMLCTSARVGKQFRLVTKGLTEEFAKRARALGAARGRPSGRAPRPERLSGVRLTVALRQ